jgi:hypothetical protein
MPDDSILRTTWKAMRATHSVRDLRWNCNTDRKATEKYPNNPREPVCTGTRVFMFAGDDSDPTADIYPAVYSGGGCFDRDRNESRNAGYHNRISYSKTVK